MEIKLINKEIPCWIEKNPVYTRCQVNMESIIPDSREDARRVIWTKGCLLLKGKEVTKSGVSISGEVCVSVLYQTESGKLDILQMKEAYEQSFELQEMTEALPQLSWRLCGLEGCLANPRKLAVSVEIQLMLRPFGQGSLLLDTQLPPEQYPGLHLRREEKDALCLCAVKEKSTTVREQLEVNANTVIPRSIAGQSCSFRSLEAELIGTNCIVKGELELLIWGLSEEGLPVSSSFRIPFSQLLEACEEGQTEIRVQGEPSSIYLDWTEGIGGERKLDAEIHAVLQLRMYKRIPVNCVRDAYSTKMPSTPSVETKSILSSQERIEAVLRSEERIPIPEDIEEASLGPLESDREKMGIALTVDFLGRGKDDSENVFRRSIRLAGDALGPGAEIQSIKLLSWGWSVENGAIKLSGEAETVWERKKTESFETVSDLDLDEDAAWDETDMPGIYLVFPHGESMWELAKKYRSSEELIASCNPEPGQAILIPAE